MKNDLRFALSVLSAQAAFVDSHFGTRKSVSVGNDVSLNALLKEIEQNATDKNIGESAVEWQEACKAARLGDQTKLTALCEVKKEYINNFARAKAQVSAYYFEQMTLGPADQQVYVNETENETTVGYLAQDGKPRMSQVLAPHDETMIPLRFIVTEPQRYAIEDVNRGPVADMAKKTLNIADDLAQQKDKNAFTLLTASLVNGGAFGAFDFTNALKHKRTLNLHSRIISANLPTTNDLAAAGNSGSTKPRFEAVKEVVVYCDKFADIFPDGPLRPTGLLVTPSIDSSAFLDLPDLTSPKQNALTEGLLTNYTRFVYGGVTWTVIPDVTLASGKMYAPLSKVPGRELSKPTMEKIILETNEHENWEKQSMRGTQGLYIPVQRRPYACRVAYKS